MRVDPRHLRIVLAVAEHGTFNRAAAALGISQPALSKSISQLERALGARLFDRGKSGTCLTAAGAIVVREAHNVERAIERAQQGIEAHDRALAGPLALGATPSMMLGLLPKVLGALTREHPRASIRVTEGLDGELLPALRRGDIEVLVGPIEQTPLPGGIEPELVELPIARETFFIGVPPDHRLAGSVHLSIGELHDEAWILPTSGSSFHRLVEALFIAHGLQLPQDAIVTNSLSFQELLVSETNRLCVLTPAQIVGRSVAFEVVPLLNAPARIIGIRYLARTRLSPLAEALIPQLVAAGRMMDGADRNEQQSR